MFNTGAFCSATNRSSKNTDRNESKRENRLNSVVFHSNSRNETKNEMHKHIHQQRTLCLELMAKPQKWQRTKESAISFIQEGFQEGPNSL